MVSPSTWVGDSVGHIGTMGLVLICGGVSFLGLVALIGLGVLLLKLGVIAQYALKREPEHKAATYSLDQSREARYEGEPDRE